MNPQTDPRQVSVHVEMQCKSACLARSGNVFRKLGMTPCL